MSFLVHRGKGEKGVENRTRQSPIVPGRFVFILFCFFFVFFVYVVFICLLVLLVDVMYCIMIY